MTDADGKRPETILDVDFGRLYRQHFAASGGREKPPEAWDARASDLSRELEGSPYVEELLRLVDLAGCRTLLDVGCGPGTIALALAPRLDRVWGLDYSRGMLDAMTRHAAARGLTNVEPILRSWEEPWDDVPACDLVLASRSTLVRDMEDALARLDAKAKRRVCLTSLVGGRFVRADVLDVLGRQGATGQRSEGRYTDEGALQAADVGADMFGHVLDHIIRESEYFVGIAQALLYQQTTQ